MKTAKTTRPTIGLALGSGSSRGLAHIGVIKVLKKQGIPIDYIAGSSIGAMVGGFYAAGLSVKKLEEIALAGTWRSMFALVDPHLKQGLISGEKVKAFISDYIGAKKIEDCKLPFAAVATDLNTGEAVVLNTGEMAQAIRASISIPVVFKPVEIAGQTLVDGGLSVPVPVETVRAMGADIVIAVNLDKYYHDEDSKNGMYDIADNALNILRHSLALANVARADMVINIDVGKNYWYQFINGQDKILTGEQATKAMMPTLQALIAKQTKYQLKKQC